MANYARIEVEVNNVNIEINDGFSLIAVGDMFSGGLYFISEICRLGRTQSGEFTQMGNLLNTLGKWAEAINNDYIIPDSSPFVVDFGGDWLSITATEYGISWAGTYTVPAYCDVIITAENPPPEPTFAIESVTYSGAQNIEPCLNARRTFNLEAGKEGTPPYGIYYPDGRVKLGIPDEANLWVEYARANGLGAVADEFQIIDQNGAGETASILVGGVRYWYQDQITVRWIEETQTTGRFQVLVQLQELNPQSQDIFLEAKIEGSLDGLIQDWDEIFISEVDYFGFIEITNLKYQDIDVSFRDDYGCEKLNYRTAENPIKPQAEAVYFESNSLNFETDQNKLFHNRARKNQLAVGFCQKFVQSQDLWVQFRSDYETRTATLINENGIETDISSYFDAVREESGTFWLNLTIPIDNKVGRYRVVVEFTQSGSTDTIFYSEWFSVAESLPYYFVLEYENTAEFYGYPDGIEWTDRRQSMLIEGEYANFDPVADKTMLKDTNNRLINLRSYPSALDIYNAFIVSDRMYERINLAFSKHKFYIDGTEYQTEEDASLEAYTGTYLHRGELKVQRVEYEIY